MSKTSLKTLSSRMLLQRPNNKLSKKDSKSKPFGFCCSLDRFDPLSRYNQRRPPYKSSLMAITSVHECPVSKMQVKFVTPRLTREKKRQALEVGDSQRSRNRKLNYSRFDKNDRFIKWYLEDEIALAKDMFWTEKQRIHIEASKKMISIGKKKFKEKHKTLSNQLPRWYQDFSLAQMRNLMNLENVIHTDYEEAKTDGTQKILIAIGVISTFFKLKPNVITELHKSSNLNSIDFLLEIYKILTGNDFYREEYKKFYDCNERIILSAIAFLTLPEALKELHKRLPVMIVPELPPKPKLPVCLARRKSSCPYEEELFKCSDWASYRNALQKWQKQYKLLQTVPKITLPCFKQEKFLISNGLLSEIRTREEDIYINHFEESNTKDFQKSSSTNNRFDVKDIVNNDEVTYEDKDFPKQENLEADKSSIFNIYPMLDNDKKYDSTMSRFNTKSETVEDKIYGASKPPMNKKSWLDKKRIYMIGDVPLKNEIASYEITGVGNLRPSSSDEKFFKMLKLDDRSTKIFPSGRENLSRNWQDWLQNADQDFEQMKEKADELMKSIQATMKSAFPLLVCDNCCSCRQTRKTEKNKVSIDNTTENSEYYVAESKSMHSPDSIARSSINLTVSQNEIKTNFIINDITKKNNQMQHVISGIQSENMHIPSQISDAPVLQFIRNVPPCSCAIQQIINKNVSPSLSQDDIPSTKDEGLCIGKKYRPNEETRTYSCKTYPGDRSCRYNPFMKEIIIESDKSKKKIPVYKVAGVVERTDEIEAKKMIPIIDGVYVTLPDSPQQKDEYIPKDDIVESPYDMSTSHITDEKLKLIERYSGSKSLLEKIQKKSRSCRCRNGFKEKKHLVDEKKNIAEIRQKLMESKLPEERWKAELKDAVLMDYCTQCKNNIPCKLRTAPSKIETDYEKTLKLTPPAFPTSSLLKMQENKGPCSCRTKSKQELSAEKTLTYLYEPDRENKSKKKIPVYKVAGIVESTDEKGAKKMVPVIEGVVYVTPPVSPQESDEYIPKDDLVESPYVMSTLFQISESSKEYISRAAAPHRHWSPVNIPPGPLPRKKEEMERRKKARDEAFKFIYGDNNEEDASYLDSSYQESDKNKLMTSYETKENHMDVEKKTSTRTTGLQSPSEKINKLEQQNKDVSYTKIASEVFEEKKYLKEATDEIVQQNVSDKQIIDKIDKNIDDEMHSINNDDKKPIDKKLIAIIKAELKKMATEGYIFAKLPKCYLVPQLLDWIMYRQSVTFSETDKKILMQTTINSWQLLNMMRMPKIDLPSLSMTERQLKSLTYNQAKEIKEKIQEARTIFHSKVRKARVSYARTMWNTMEYGKFPSTSFKRAFFTYMACKEADGHVYKPWCTSEVHKRS